MRAKGIDISKWQQEFIYQDNLDFIIIKATEGWDYDPWYEENLPEVNKVPIRGAYHYYRTATDPVVQAENFLAYVAKGNFHFICVDYEAKNNVLDQTGANNFLLCLSYLADNQDLPVVLYTSPYIYRDNLVHWHEEFMDYPAWIARYSGADPETGNPMTGIIVADWHIWQFSDENDGELYGATSDYVDMSVYNGTAQEMKAWLGLLIEVDIEETLKKVISSTLLNSIKIENLQQGQHELAENGLGYEDSFKEIGVALTEIEDNIGKLEGYITEVLVGKNGVYERIEDLEYKIEGTEGGHNHPKWMKWLGLAK